MEQIFKLQPDRCLALRGFDSFAAAAALHSATPNSFQVSGTFRDQADFAVLVLWDADNYFEHPSLKYLPDFNFSGLVLTFDVQYTGGIQPIDSPKFNWIDWATLDCILANDSVAVQHRPKIQLWDHTTLKSGTFTPASGTFTLTAGPNGPQPGDNLTIWFENVAFSYTVPVAKTSVEYQFFVAGNGIAHTITVNAATYTYTESNSTGAGIASGLVALVNAGSGDLHVTASVGSVSNAVLLTAKTTSPDMNISTAATGNVATQLTVVTLPTVAAAICGVINASPGSWQQTGGGLAVMAANSGAVITIQAARYGIVNTNGAIVSWAAPNPDPNTHLPNWSDKFPGLATGAAILINGTPYTVATVNSPTQLTLTAAPPANLLNANYLAPRGGIDGNLFTLYATAQPPSGSTAVNLNTTQPTLQLSGGNSAVTWTVSIDFSALGIDQLRQCWLTFAPALAAGAANTSVDWLASFSNWTVTGANRLLKLPGPGSLRIEENSTWCTYKGSGWIPADVNVQRYSKYAANASNDAGDSVTVAYQCAFVHNLYIGTSLYIDSGSVSVVLDGAPLADANFALNGDSAVISRRLLAAAVPAGSHTIVLTSKGTGPVYFDFLEAAVLSDWIGPARTFKKISPALDFDTDHTYKLSPARVLWIFSELGFAGPVNEYLGVFWWNQRKPVGGVYPQATVTFAGKFVAGDAAFVTVNGSFTLGKSVSAGDTNATIAAHFAYFLNATSTSAWAASTGAVLTITSRSAASAYTLQVTSSTALISGSMGTATAVATHPTATYPTWTIDPTIQPVLNRAVTDWHSDFYSLCAAANLEVTTAGSMELVFPPSGFAASFPDGTPVATATDVATSTGTLFSTQCAVGGLQVIAYQKQVYEAIAALQAAAHLTPSVQFGEFLWWYFGNPQNTPNGMAYYDAETKSAAQTALNRALHVFLTPNDDPTANSSADAIFLRNRLRDHVAALASDLRGKYPAVKIEVLYPYDVNYPSPVVPGSQLGGRLNYFVNLPVEWKQQATSGLDRIKVEGLQFSTAFRNLDLAGQTIQLMPNFGWPRNSVRYLVPVFGTFVPWQSEANLAFGQNLDAVNLWAFDQLCLYGLDIANLKEPPS